MELVNYQKTAKVIRALNHPIRLRIVSMLSDQEEMTVTDIYIKLRCEQTVASMHLGMIRRANVLKSKRRGNFVYYKLNESRLLEINRACEIMTSHKITSTAESG